MKSNTILIIIGALVLAGGAYYYLTNSANDPALTASPEVSRAQAQFQTLTGQLPRSFNLSIFSDPRFTTFVDISQQIQPEPVGRIDPLAPIPGVASSK